MSSSTSSSDRHAVGTDAHRGGRTQSAAIVADRRDIAVSPTSSGRGNRWRRFFALAAGTAAGAIAVVWLFAVLVDPFDALPLAPPANRVPVASNARYAFPSLARSPRFDSAVFGTSTSRLLRPVALDPLFHARFANLAMNAATVHETLRLLRVFRRSHAAPKYVLLGVDVGWCTTGPTYQMFTERSFPAWLYDDNPWTGYREMLNLYAVQSAGQLFGILIGVKAPVYGRDGYTRFVPPDEAYDREKVARKLADTAPWAAPGTREGPPATWRYPAVDALRGELAALPPMTRKLLFFVPYHRGILPPEGSDVALPWEECKRRMAALGQDVPNLAVADFMRPSPMTGVDDHYWDPIHYTVAIADRLARRLSDADHGTDSDDYRLLFPEPARQGVTHRSPN
jgi:hypothetical protein